MPSAEHLAEFCREISKVGTLEDVLAVVCRHARRLLAAQGAGFILREEDTCHHAHEDSIELLLLGRRLPLSDCIGGWCMIHRAPVVVPDLATDERFPDHPYRHTFVRGLALAPVRPSNPVGAVAVYWDRPRRLEKRELEVLQAVADAASVAVERTTAGPPAGRDEAEVVPPDERCRNLYTFARLRLGAGISDREIARRWGMSWRSFLNLKEGNRRLPRLEELESLAAVLGLDPSLVVLVARGEPAEVVDRWLRAGEESVRTGLMARFDAGQAGGATALTSTLERVTCGLFTTDLASLVRDRNERFVELLAPRDVKIGSHLLDYVAAAATETLLELQTQALEHGESGPELVRLVNGVPVEVSMVRIDDHGRAVGFQGLLVPLSEPLRALMERPDA